MVHVFSVDLYNFLTNTLNAMGVTDDQRNKINKNT